MNLDIVKDGINKDSDVRVLIREQFQHNRHHLSLVQHDLPRWSKEQELKESVQNLLNHFVVFLLRAQQFLQQFYQVRARNYLSNIVVPADGSDEHDALKKDVVLSILVHKVVVDESDEVEFLYLVHPQVRWDVNHGSKQLKQQVSVLVRHLS